MTTLPSLPTHARVVDRRRRRHRHVDRVSPRVDGVAGRRAARAPPAHGRHDLARSGTHGHVRIDVGNVDRTSQVHARPLRPARSRDRTSDRLHADRLHRSRFRQGPPRGIPARRRVQPLLRYRRAGDLAAPGAGALPAREGRRHRSRLLREGRRAREPGRRDDGARQGRAHARREDSRRRTGNRSTAEERACHRGQHAIRRHPDRLRRELRRPVGTRAGRSCRAWRSRTRQPSTTT